MIGGNNATVVFIWSRQIIYLNVSMIYVLIIGLHLRIFMAEMIDAMTTNELFIDSTGLVKVLIKHYYPFGRTSCFICDNLRYAKGGLCCHDAIKTFRYWYELNHMNPLCGDYEPRFD